MKISVIVVSWNVRTLLEECLASLELYGNEVIREVVVVDNASHDGSSAMVREKYPNVNLIVNSTNRGFAAACNQGVAASSGEYVLFLNPDTKILAGSLHALLAHAMEKNAAVAAPQLLYDDGSVQPSVRQFPTPWSALLVFLRIKKETEVAYIEARQIQQPMGACMLIKKSILDTVGIFDEKYFLWFDEVDLCKRIHDAGHSLWYFPDAQIIHSGGKSFAQKPSLEKQKIFYTSFAHFLFKHYRWRAVLPVGLMRMYVFLLHHPIESVTLFLCLLLEGISFLGYFAPPVYGIGFGVIVIATLFLSLKNLRTGFGILAAELIIGSQGHLFALSLGDKEIPVRMGIFAAIMLAWLIGFVRKPSQNGRFFKAPSVRAYAILAMVVMWGVVSGFLHQNSSSFIYQDANAWLFFLLVMPLYDAVTSWRDISFLRSVAVGAVIAQMATAFKALYIMSHQRLGADMVYAFYRWIRETGLGEITQFEWGGVRVFFQSMIYPLFFFAALLPRLKNILSTESLYQVAQKQGGLLLGILLMSTLIVLSFSRSFWLAASIIVGAALVICLRSSVRLLFKMSVAFTSCFAISLLLIAAITLFPIPQPNALFGLDAFAKRLDLDESAAKSRWSLLPILGEEIKKNPIMGYGFGKAVTYTSYDPRVREKNKAGTYTTFAFEWGYLDMIIKWGVIGFALYLLFLGTLLRQAWTVNREDSPRGRLVQGLFWASITLLLVHVFTPYLNHPLGIALLLFLTRVVDLDDTERNQMEVSRKYP